MTLPVTVTLTGESESLYAGFTKVNTAIGYILAGDGTSRAFRLSSVAIKDDALADNIKVSMTSSFNGDTIAQETGLAKSDDGTSFNLDATGSQLHIKSGGITGNATHALMAVIYLNKTDYYLNVQASIASNGITLTFTDMATGDAVDLTAVADSSGGELYLNLLYLTDA